MKKPFLLLLVLVLIGFVATFAPEYFPNTDRTFTRNALTKNVYEQDLAADWKQIRSQLDPTLDYHLTRFEMEYEANGTLLELHMTLQAPTQGGEVKNVHINYPNNSAEEKKPEHATQFYISRNNGENPSAAAYIRADEWFSLLTHDAIRTMQPHIPYDYLKLEALAPVYQTHTASPNPVTPMYQLHGGQKTGPVTKGTGVFLTVYPMQRISTIHSSGQANGFYLLGRGE
ncbi:MAG TPA: hypothetical protein VFV52_03930 [Bacilli bacterium]|nr:hypothetical protein [Bacilli bacterium]